MSHRSRESNRALRDSVRTTFDNSSGIALRVLAAKRRQNAAHGASRGSRSRRGTSPGVAKEQPHTGSSPFCGDDRAQHQVWTAAPEGVILTRILAARPKPRPDTILAPGIPEERLGAKPFLHGNPFSEMASNCAAELQRPTSASLSGEGSGKGRRSPAVRLIGVPIRAPPVGRHCLCAHDLSVKIGL